MINPLAEILQQAVPATPASPATPAANPVNPAQAAVDNWAQRVNAIFAELQSLGQQRWNQWNQQRQSRPSYQTMSGGLFPGRGSGSVSAGWGNTGRPATVISSGGFGFGRSGSSSGSMLGRNPYTMWS